MRLPTRFLATAAVLVVVASPAAAQVVVNGGAPNGNAGWNIFDDNRAATSFTVSSSTSFDAVRFWGILFQNAPYSPTIFWQILADAGGSPGTGVVAQGSSAATSTLRTQISPSAFSWQFDFSTGLQTLGTGVFWLALHDGALDPSGYTGSSLLWETSDAPGSYAIQTFSIDDSWSPGGDQSLAFQLRSEVTATPEPGTLGLIAIGFVSLSGIGLRSRRRRRRAGSLASICALVALSAIASPVRGQQAPKTYYACYVPLTGTVYRIKEADLRTTCSSASHVEFSWTSSGGVTSHAALTGLSNDDHPQYLLGDGVRSSTNGFAVIGTGLPGAIPVSGPGTRLMWYPAKGAFRAGHAQIGEWDDAFIGVNSAALGFGTVASGNSSMAFGGGAAATGDYSLATGLGSKTLGIASTAMGRATFAIADASFAAGTEARAAGTSSFALGERVTVDHPGAFLYSGIAGAPVGLQTIFRSAADNEFAVRALGGFRFRTEWDLSTGCNLPAGSGTWSCTSSRLAKERFENVNGDDVLSKITAMPIQAWSYRTEPGNIRHVGPTAQDFRAAFRLGDSDEAISLVDIDGINMLGIQALAKRSRTLERENAQLRSRLDRLEALIHTLEQSVHPR